MEDTSARGAEPSPPRPRVRPADAWFVLLAGAALALDQLSKWFIRTELDRGDAWEITGFFRIVHITNSGAAFGILQGAGPLLVVTSLMGMAAIFVFLFNPGFAHPLMRSGLALMLGGAVGNLVDRLANGRVVDFLKVPHWPAFNLADSAITIGVLLLLWAMLQEPENEANSAS